MGLKSHYKFSVTSRLTVYIDTIRPHKLINFHVPCCQNLGDTVRNFSFPRRIYNQEKSNYTLKVKQWVRHD